MKLRITLLAVAAIATAMPVLAKDSLVPERVAQAARDRVDAGEYPALVVVVVDGSRSEVRGFGRLADGKAPDGRTVFEIGSITKTFTALLLARQVESGAVRLDEPVSELLPGVQVPSRNGKTITLENLATQHSGLPRLPTNMVPAGNDPYAHYGSDQLKAFLASYQLGHDPGSTYAYSNLGFGLLGHALAEHAHATYGQLLQRQIFAPLSMHDSAVRLDDALRARLAGGHGENGKLTAPWNFDALAGAGAIKSTGNDMLRYLQANMGQLPSPLDAALRLTHTARADTPLPHERIGLAWMIRKEGDRTVTWHNGMTSGYASFMGFTADGKHGVVVLTNQQQSVDDLGLAVLLPDTPLHPAHKTISLAAADLDAYVGSYQLAPGFILNVFRDDGQLYGQATGQGALPLFASARDEFFAKVADIRISFQRTDGKVSGLVLHQHGDHPAPRLDAADAAAAGKPKTVTLEHAVLAGYVGRYRLAPTAVFDITLQGDQLRAQLTGQPALPIYASAKDHFFYRVVPARIDFERDASGQVKALVLHQNGADHRAPRIGQ